MKIKFETECGETVCASSPGRFCKFAGSKRFGTKPWCIWYDRQLFENKAGWLQRTKQCIEDHPPEKKIKVICSWCGTVKSEGIEPPSHGICADCSKKHFPE